MKRTLLSFLAIIALSATAMILPQAAQAKEQIYTGTFSSDAVSGYDTVAYFTDGKPVKGNKKFKTSYKGTNWLFSSQKNLDAFKASPEKYAPQYGGYCAYAIGEYNDLVSADAKIWKIVDGKLYLNYDADIQKKWASKQPEYIKKGDANWPKLNK